MPRWAILLLVALLPGTLMANPIQWPAAAGGNDHFYEVVSVGPGGIIWDDAVAAAQARGGYLATLTSAAENNFVFQNLVNNPLYWMANDPPFQHQFVGPWIGGFQPPGSPEPAGNWQWLNGEGPFTFANWHGGEPNNFNGTEHRVLFFSHFSGIANAWNDVPEDGLPPSYLVEYVPEPSGLVLLAVAGAACIFRRRPR